MWHEMKVIGLTFAIAFGVLVVETVLAYLMNVSVERMVAFFLLSIWAQRDARRMLTRSKAQ